MKFVLADQLNPNAVNARYGRPWELTKEWVEQTRIEASTLYEAWDLRDRAVESGIVGYSRNNPMRDNVTFFLAEEWDAGIVRPLGQDEMLALVPLGDPIPWPEEGDW